MDATPYLLVPLLNSWATPVEWAGPHEIKNGQVGHTDRPRPHLYYYVIHAMSSQWPSCVHATIDACATLGDVWVLW